MNFKRNNKVPILVLLDHQGFLVSLDQRNVRPISISESSTYLTKMSFLLSLVFVLCLPQNNTKTVQKPLVQKHFCNVMFLHLSFFHISTKRKNSLVLKVKKGIQRSDFIQIRSRHCLKRDVF